MTEASAFIEISELQKELQEIFAKKDDALPSERMDEIRSRLDVLMESLNPLLTEKQVEGLLQTFYEKVVRTFPLTMLNYAGGSKPPWGRKIRWR